MGGSVDVAMKKASRLAGEIAGRSVALAEEAAVRGLAAAQKTSSVTAEEFLRGFKRGRGKKRI
ncbi:MAG: hypothetical protein HYS81_01765 [Candidatus Aenigmatarchaeota archaeon]|nr:MAG: hypothetical protein HYS81_01765 [Candidatus Aenigmarchaeota archaeon]